MTGQDMARTALAEGEPGGVACADPPADGRGHGTVVSCLDQRVPNIVETAKSTSSQAQDVQNRKRDPVQAAKDRRHARKATREQMIQAQRKAIREGVPYARPPEAGGVV